MRPWPLLYSYSAEMRFIKVPPKVTLLDPITRVSLNATLELREFVCGILVDKRFSVNYKTLLSAQRIDTVISAISRDGVVALEQADWELLKECVESPTEGYRPGFGVQAISFIRAIMEASEEMPATANGKATPFVAASRDEAVASSGSEPR